MSDLFDSNSERKFSLSNPKDVKDSWELAKEKTITGLYKDDPLIRASLDAVMNTPTPKPKSSVVMRDAQGKVTGVEGGSVLTGRNATNKAERELWNALKEQLLNTKTNTNNDNNNGNDEERTYGF